MLQIFNITAPIFFIISLGYGAVRFGVFRFEELRGTAKFVMKVGLPALVFFAIAAKPVNEVFDAVYLAGYAAATLAAFFIGWLFGRLRGGDSRLAALSGAPAPRGAHARMPVVRLVFDDGVSRDLSGTLVVGRNPSVDPAHRGAELMPIADRQKSVSKTHAALTATPQGLLVEDLRSTNGTVVISADGNPVPVAPGFPIWATDGASVLFGGRRVKVVIR